MSGGISSWETTWLVAMPYKWRGSFFQFCGPKSFIEQRAKDYFGTKGFLQQRPRVLESFWGGIPAFQYFVQKNFLEHRLCFAKLPIPMLDLPRPLSREYVGTKGFLRQCPREFWGWAQTTSSGSFKATQPLQDSSPAFSSVQAAKATPEARSGAGKETKVPGHLLAWVP